MKPKSFRLPLGTNRGCVQSCLFTAFSLFFTALSFGQIPAGYYNTATGTGYTLKTQLHNIIDGHDDQGYSSIDDFFPANDKDQYYENNNTILDIYSENPDGADPYNYSASGDGDQCGNYDSEGDCYNAEHVIPQSVFSQAAPMRGDAHHLLPTDGRVNGFRSNYPFGVAGTLVSQSGITNPTMNGSKLGNNLNSGYSAGYTGIVFEPIDEFKGDIARIYFYFVTRYQDVIGGWGAYPMFDGTSNKSIADPFLNILLTWHEMDPVSQKEIDRNNDIYTYQGNRNPFVDHPEYACMIWNANCALATDEFAFEGVDVSPNPSANQSISLNGSVVLDRIRIVNTNGQTVKSVENPATADGHYTIPDMPAGFYFVEITSQNHSAVRKAIVR
jgi:endonuclease I